MTKIGINTYNPRHQLSENSEKLLDQDLEVREEVHRVGAPARVPRDEMGEP